jgi:hypothetical protein
MDEDPCVGVLVSDEETFVYQDRKTRMLYFLGPQPRRYISMRSALFYEAPKHPRPPRPGPIPR